MRKAEGDVGEQLLFDIVSRQIQRASVSSYKQLGYCYPSTISMATLLLLCCCCWFWCWRVTQVVWMTDTSAAAVPPGACHLCICADVSAAVLTCAAGGVDDGH
jgi:hypothetical protein